MGHQEMKNITFNKIDIEKDLAHIMSWVNDPQIKQYFAAFDKNISIEEEEYLLNNILEQEKKEFFTSYTRSITIDGDYAGQIAINKIYWPARNGQLFIVLNKDFRGKGLAATILNKFLQQVKQEIGLHKIWLIVRNNNKKAQSLYLKIGFDFEGLLKDEYFVPGQGYCDMVRMGLVLDKWLPSP